MIEFFVWGETAAAAAAAAAAVGKDSFTFMSFAPRIVRCFTSQHKPSSRIIQVVSFEEKESLI